MMKWKNSFKFKIASITQEGRGLGARGAEPPCRQSKHYGKHRRWSKQVIKGRRYLGVGAVAITSNSNGMGACLLYTSDAADE